MASAVANSRTHHHQKQKLNGVPASPSHPGRSGGGKSGDGHGQVLGGGYCSVRSSRSSTSAAATGTATPTPPVAASSRRSVTPTSRDRDRQDQDSVRVRVAIRLRPKTPEDLLLDSDHGDCVELQPELKKLKLRKNNWNSESYRFDEVFTETASQKRVYEVVAKPVVESVLDGYNGTIMAYGQTGTGKTYTVGHLGKEDPSQRGIMVRALEDILNNISHASECVEVSYLQLYMESIQDLLSPEKTSIHIAEDPRTGTVTLPGATVAYIRDLDHFLELLQAGEANRHAANTKLNTESSRSHAVLMVNVRRSVNKLRRDENLSPHSDKNSSPDVNDLPMVRKSKLLIVDLAGSERIDKSGSEGHLLEEAKFINLSLSSLGKCINALAENSPHIPTRESKLTRLLRDSFGGAARTSLIITIGPSARHHAETTSTILFGQRAMKIVNTMKLKEELDYESLCRKLENQIDHLTTEIERQQKLRENDKFKLESQLVEFKESICNTEKDLIKRSEFLGKENSQLQSQVKELLIELNRQKDEKHLLMEKIAELQMDENHILEKQQLDISTYQNVLADTTQMYEKKVTELMNQLEEESLRTSRAEDQLLTLKKLLSDQEIAIQTSESCPNNCKRHEKSCSSYQKSLLETTQTYDKKIIGIRKQLENKHSQFEATGEQLDLARKLLSDHHCFVEGQKEIDELSRKLEEMYKLHDDTLHELESLQSEHRDHLMEKVKLDEELHALTKRLLEEEQRRKTAENELIKLRKLALETQNDWQDKHLVMKEINRKGSSLSATGFEHTNALRETQSSQRSLLAKICEEVGFERMLALLKSEDIDVQTHAVKVIANLAAEDSHQEKIVEEGGLEALLMLLRSSQSMTILRVAAGAIANLAMNVLNQGLIMSKGGAQLLAKTASKTDDPQTLRMVAGAIANLCGNERLHEMLKEDGGIKALLGTARCGSSDVISQVARGIANFAKCESRAILQGHRKGSSPLLEEGALTWLLANSDSGPSSIRRHIELALCHLAQNKDNWKHFMSSGAVKELERISVESNREDIQNLARKASRDFHAYQVNINA